MTRKTYYQAGIGKTQEAIARMVRPGSRVLELGCATGYMTRHLAREMGCRVTAVDINPQAAKQAGPFAEQVIVGDLAGDAVWNEIPDGFDHAIYADVLEHLADPGLALRRTSEHLGPDGCVCSSIPNVAYYKIRKELLLGRWDYTESGIMDDTHLRFFTQKTISSLFLDNGYEILETVRIYRAKTDWRLHLLCPNAFTYQFVTKAAPLR